MRTAEGVRRRRRVAGRATRTLLLGLLAASLTACLTGCGVGMPRTVGPTGIDGLQVPTPSPRPDDFVARVDNPWLPLVPGSRWRYEEIAAGGVVATVEVTVAEGTEEVAGVATTVVRRVVRDEGGAELRRVEAWYAQDRAGNVWRFGESVATRTGRRTTTAGSWLAGTRGAEAALAMPAEPRRGDGYRLEHAPGVAEDRARVVDLSAQRTTPAAGWDDLLETEVTTPLVPSLLQRRFFARGVGLVRLEHVTGPDAGHAVVLVEHAAG